MENSVIVFRNRSFNYEDLEKIKQIIQTHWNRGRTYISKVLSQHLDWRQPNGQLKDQVCRLLLLRLEEKGYIKLPPRKKSANNELRSYYRSRGEILQNLSISPIIGKVAQIQPIELRQVRKSPQEHLWNELVNKYL